MFDCFRRAMMTLGESITEGAKQHLDNLPHADSTTLAGIVNYVLYAVGLLSVVMVIVGGVQMTTSAGDPSAVAKARKTITYSVVGLIVAILAYAIVNFVVVKITQ